MYIFTAFVLDKSVRHVIVSTGPPRLARPPRPGPYLDFGFQYALIRNNRSKKIGVEYWALPGSYSPWRPCSKDTYLVVFKMAGKQSINH